MSTRERSHVPVAACPTARRCSHHPGSWSSRTLGARVVCHACGDLLTHISPAHLTHHGLDGQTYRQRYGLAIRRSLAAPGLADARAREGRRRYEGNSALRAGLEHGQGRTHRLAKARLAHVRILGFDSLEEYWRHRYVDQGWSVHAIGAGFARADVCCPD